jgi:tetratricopeptide (TPR) repeat protein
MSVKGERQLFDEKKTMRNIIHIIMVVSLLASCAGSKKETVADNRYRRPPMVEVTAAELSKDSALIDATMQQLLGKEEESAEMYRKLIGRDPSYSPAHYGLGRLYFAMGWLDSALYHTQKACELDNGNPWYRVQLARIYEQMRDGKSLKATWEELVKRYPDNTEYYYNLANAYLYCNDVQGSIEVLDRVEKRFGINEAVSIQKQKLWNAVNRPDKARKELEKLAEAVPSEPRYSAILAESYMNEKNYIKALQYYNNILEANPSDENIHISLASCNLAMGNLHDTYKHLRLGVRNPGMGCRDRMVYISELLHNEAFFNAYGRKCFALADSVAGMCGENDGYAVLYGQMLAAQERYQEAAKQFKVHLATDKSQYAVWEALLICEGQYAEGAEELLKHAQEASELFPLHLRPYLILVEGYLNLDNCEKARFYMDRCLMIAPNEVVVKELKQKIDQRCQ